MSDRLATIRKQIAECAEHRRLLVGYLAGLRLNGEWGNPAVQREIKALKDAKALVEEAKRWISEGDADDAHG